MISQEELKEALEYDPNTGIFTWKISSGYKIKVGDVAGCRHLGYIIIQYKRRQYKAHRLAWLYVTGKSPSTYIDHIDGNGLDNSWINLRLANNQQNQFNVRRSEWTGITFPILEGIPYVRGHVATPTGPKSKTLSVKKYGLLPATCQIKSWVLQQRIQHHGEFERYNT